MRIHISYAINNQSTSETARKLSMPKIEIRKLARCDRTMYGHSSGASSVLIQNENESV